MALRGIYKAFFPSGWLYGEVEDLKNQNKSMYSMIKGLFTQEAPLREENFDQAMERLGLTEKYIQKVRKRYQMYAIFFLILTIAIFAYTFYLLFAYFSITGFLLGIAASAFCVAQAFKFDFWAYQIKVRKLGVTFDEWKRNLLGDKGTSA